MTYLEAIDYLYRLRWFGAKLGLENTLKLAALAGNPQEKLRFIHVAGTNGKGSTCAMLESVYRQTGLRVGLFTSPHLVSFRERIQVNRKLIPEADVARLVSNLQGLLADFASEQHPTFFEVVTVMALEYFAEQSCDLVIWETGMGGRLDATNIVKPMASLITNVQYDHQQWLGNTLTEIAREKAGIIKPGVPVLTTTEAPEALSIIRDTAALAKSPLHLIGAPEIQPTLSTSRILGLVGEHQQINAALAVETARTLQNMLPVTDKELRAGLAGVVWPGRFQLLERASGQKVLLDGAHNPGGAESLAATFRSEFPEVRPTLILGVLKDKDWERMCRVLAPLAERVLCVPVRSERTAHPDELMHACRKYKPSAECRACGELAEAFAASAKSPFLLLTGSLYLVGQALELLGAPGFETTQEPQLNELLSTP